MRYERRSRWETTRERDDERCEVARLPTRLLAIRGEFRLFEGKQRRQARGGGDGREGTSKFVME
jgi:hypothetical protein